MYCLESLSAVEYFAFGLHIASEIPLPEFQSLRAPRAADLAIHFATLPAALSNGAEGDRQLEMRGDEVVLTIDKVARFRISGGREIAIDPFPGASERVIRLFLLGSAMGVLCHQRRLLPLHANAVVVNGCAMAFAGRSGIGKSTLAGHLQSRGYDVLCDDVCVVSFEESGRPLVWPGLARLKLWRDAAEAFGHDSRTLEQAMDGIEKYYVPLPGSVAKAPLPLARLYVLGDSTPHTIAGIARLTGMAALEAILSNTYRNQYLGPMGLAHAHVDQAVLVTRHIDVFAAPRQRGYDVFAREAATLERHLTSVDNPSTRHARTATGVEPQ